MTILLDTREPDPHPWARFLPDGWRIESGTLDTRDLANRAIVTRIRKQPASYVFTQYPEGDLMSHVQGNQSFYLGCVFSILREWVACGKPRTSDTRHDFRGWTLGRLFKEGIAVDENTSRLTVDGIAVTRETFHDYNAERQLKTRQRYIFAKGGK